MHILSFPVIDHQATVVVNAFQVDSIFPSV